jgi:hypothetical protein
MMGSRFIGAMAMALLLSWTMLVGAQPGGEPRSEADALYEQGLNDMLAEKYDTGCPALARSYDLDPLAGALFTMAECFSKWGKVATAVKHYRAYLNRVESMSAAEKQEQGGRPDVALDNVQKLEGRVPHVTLVPPPDPPQGLSVTVNGEPVAADAFGSRIGVDPGEVHLVVRSPEHTDHEEVVTVAIGENRTINLSLGAPSDGPSPDPGTGGSGMLTAAYVVGGIGIAGVLIGTIAGAVALGKKGTISDECTDTACTPDGLDAVDSGQTAGDVSTVAFIIGTLAVGVGVTLFLLAPEDSEPAEIGDLRVIGGLSHQDGYLGLELAW